MEDTKRYFEDLETIRELMTRYEEQPIVKHWVFYFWGLTVIAGSIINYILYQSIGLRGVDALLRVWVPVFAIGSLGETLGWLFQARDSGMAILTRRTRRLLTGYLGIFVILFMIVIDGIPAGMHAGTLLAIGSVPALIYAQLTFGSLYIEGFALLAVALVMRIFDANTAELRLTVGIVCGVTYVVMGFHSYVVSARRSRAGE